MRIYGPNDPRTQGQVPLRSQNGQPVTGVQHEHLTRPGASARSQFIGRVPDISPEQMQVLETELAAAGINRSTLDPAGLYRALQLHHHGLPLTKAAVTLELSDIPSVIRGAAALIVEVRQLLDTGSLPASERTLLMELAGNLEALFEASGSTGAVNTGVLEEWAAGTELKLLALLATGDAGRSITDTLSGAGRLLFSHEALARLGGDVVELVTGFREATAQLRAAITGIDIGAAEAAGQFQAVVARFETALSSLTGFTEGTGIDGSLGNLMPMIKELFGRQVALLQNQYIPLLAAHGTGGNTAQPGGSASLVGQSGLMFEWRLFSWYVSGGNPERLRQLMQHDLKGVLLSFLAGLKGRNKPDAQNGPHSRIEQHVRSLVDHIETQQLATLNGRSDPRQPVFFELPVAGRPGSGQARVKMSGEPQSSPADRPRELTLSFAVETTILGAVTANMRIVGDAVSVEFFLTREEWKTLGEKQADDIREQLRGQGFTVGDIIFRQFDEISSDEPVQGSGG